MRTKVCCLFCFALSFACLIVQGCNSTPKSDVREQVAAFGLDYDQTKKQALHDDCVLRRFFAFSMLVDGAGNDEYGDDLLNMLELVGEERFLRCLHIGWNIQNQVIEVIRYSEGFDQVGGIDRWCQFQKRNPGLSALMQPVVPPENAIGQ